MKIFSSVVIIILISGALKAAELVSIPKGQIEAIWLSPMSKKAKNKTAT